MTGASTQESMFHAEQTHEIKQETVKFEEDGPVDEEVASSAFDTSFLLAASDSLENSVKNFLARPVLMTEFKWLSSDVDLKQYVHLNFPGNWIARPMIKEKLAGFKYFRGTIVVRMQVNAQPFNAGRLIMYFAPFGNTQTSNPTNQQHFGGITGYRHIDLDLSESTSVEMRIPYMSPLTHIDLVSGKGEMGNVHVIVYSPLTGGDFVEGAIWAHFEDVSVEMPTGQPLHGYTAPAVETLYAQSGTGKVNPKGEKKKGDFETLFDAQKTVAKKMGKVPVIGPIADGIGWLAGAASGVAGMFGFSKPTNPDFETPVHPKFMKHSANYNGQSQAKTLGLDARNAVIQPSGTFGTDEDEMSLAAILQKPVFFNKFFYDASQVPGAELTRFIVAPDYCTSKLVTGAPTYIQYNETYLSYMSRLFDLWRGGIDYHFKVVKTPFHSGRIRITFVPGAGLSTDMSTVDRDKCYTRVIDIRDLTSFDVGIPYVNNRFWSTIVSAEATFPPHESIPSGLVVIEVLNSLRNAGQSADKIDIIIEQSAAEDFQFGFFNKDNLIFPRRPAQAPSPSETLVAQIGGDSLFDKQSFPGFEPNTVSTGEAITSTRQLLKRLIQVTGTTTPIFPFAVLNSLSTTQSESAVGLPIDIFTYVSNIFRLMSGSMRYTFIPQGATPSDQPQDKIFTLVPAARPKGALSGFIAELEEELEFTGGLPLQLFFSPEQTMEVDVPWYQEYQSMLTNVGSPLATDNPGASKVPYNEGTQLIFQADIPWDVYRTVGEDFSMGYLIGPPLNFVPYSV
jgi:hypothetical protein